MSFIHNHKKRMPIMLKKGDESAWLDAKNDIPDFALPYEVECISLSVK